MKILLLILVALVTSSVVATEETEGMRAMRLGCEKQKLGLGCTNYANFLIKNGRESEADAYFDKGCKLGNQDGCEKKRWAVKEVIAPEPEVPVEPPIVEENQGDTPVETPEEMVPESTQAIPSPAEETIPSPADETQPVE